MMVVTAQTMGMVVSMAMPVVVLPVIVVMMTVDGVTVGVVVCHGPNA